MARGNTFYSDFDTERLGTRGDRDPDPARSPFRRDRDRILHSYAFRRLQSKTQVFQPGEYDFYRTRLTHSIEVAQIGRSLCAHLQHRGDPLGEDFFIDSDLVEAVCLAHDLGHPPFGHSGERALHKLMEPYGGFEGNAQTLGIVTRDFYEPGKGMAPSRAFLDGILKYKALWSEAVEAERARTGDPGALPHHHFLYDEQAELRTFAHGTDDITAGKSIDCQIMDWADDTAYSLNDIADGVRAGFLTIERLRRWREDPPGGFVLEEKQDEWLDTLEKAMVERSVERRFSSKIGRFIQATSLRRDDSRPLADRTNRHAFVLDVDGEAEAESKLYKRIALDLIFQSRAIQQFEHKGAFVLGRIWESLWRNFPFENGRTVLKLRILSKEDEARVLACRDEQAKARLFCDLLAGMTDRQAARLYKRLFEPDFGSIHDLG